MQLLRTLKIRSLHPLRLVYSSSIFFPPGLEYEIALAQNTTLDLNAYLGFQMSFNSNNSSSNYFLVRPVFEGQVRQYYNFRKRQKMSLNTDYNSGNFVALDGIYMLKSLNKPENVFVQTASVFAIGPVWGMNRAYPKGFNLSLHVGAGYISESYEDYNDSYPGILWGVRLGLH